MKKALITIAVAAAILGGCNKNKATTKHAKADWKNQTVAAAPSTQPSVASTQPSVSHPLAGAWQMAIPRQNAQEACITAKDATHVTIQAGDKLSGDYVVQGSYLLIVTRDESRRTIAWRINSNDSLTVVRGPNSGKTWTGVTLVRAADGSTADASWTDSASESTTGENAQTEADTSEALSE